MDGKGSHDPLTDSALDREIESALGIEPSPEFLARVRTRIASEPRARSWRLALRGWAVEPLVGVAMIGIVLAVVVPEWRRDRQPTVVPKPQVVRLNPDATAARVAPKPPVVESQLVEAGPVERTPAVRNRAAVTRTTPRRLSEPLFSDEERRVFESFVAAVQAGRMPPRPETNETGDEPRAMIEIPIEPLIIEPLPQLARVGEEGERQ